MRLTKHLISFQAIAPKYFNTRFLRVFVENVPWLVEKLDIKVLPCVICFVDGTAKERCPLPLYFVLPRGTKLTTTSTRLIGFEQLGNSDSFEIAALELRLQTIGIYFRRIANFFVELTPVSGVIDKPGPSNSVQHRAERTSTRNIRTGTIADDADDSDFDY